MLIKKRRGWELPESAATPESVFLNRRQLMKSVAAGTALIASGPFLGSRAAHAGQPWDDDPSLGLYDRRLPTGPADGAAIFARLSRASSSILVCVTIPASRQPTFPIWPCWPPQLNQNLPVGSIARRTLKKANPIWLPLAPHAHGLDTVVPGLAT